jgi:hypothetical protein
MLRNVMTKLFAPVTPPVGAAGTTEAREGTRARETAAPRHKAPRCSTPFTPTMTILILKPVILLAALSAASAATSVAVLEFGSKRGSVRRTVSADRVDTTVAGVHSFLNALHRNRRGLQHAGMPLVPDLFTRSDLGIVLALKGDGVDLAKMPVVSSLLEEDVIGKKESAVVGHLEMEGSKCHALMNKVGDVKKATSPSEMSMAVKAQTEGKGLVGVETTVDAANVQGIDASVNELMQNLQEWAEASGKTIVLHLVVEEEGGSSRRRARSLSASSSAASTSTTLNQNERAPPRRRLEDENAGEQYANAAQGSYNGYYGYGYYNAYGEWVTPYKTMFQIQYFNVVLWTALGLVAALVFVIYLMIYMPLEPDTLLFGESAKLVGSE